MAYLGYLCLGGQQIVNDCRTLQRVADGVGPPGIQCRSCDPCCGDLSAGLGYPNGYNPTDMPWFDGTQASVDFAGLMIENIEGLEPGPFTRPITESAGYGAVIGQGRQSAPTVTVTALVLAATCCAAEYGLTWLRSALRGSCRAGSTCSGDDLIFLSCEPETPDLDCPENVDFDFEAWLAPYYRTLKGVSLIDGPRVIERLARACPSCNSCGIPRVQFTLAASRPCVFLDPVDLATGATFDCSDFGECIEWVTDPTDDCEDCPQIADCATDPDCQNIIAPPPVPAILNPCVEECISDVTCRVNVTVPAGTFPSNGEGTLVVTIDNSMGADPIRRIKLQVWENPAGIGIDLLDDCGACSEINVSYLAPFSTLVIDGANGTSTITCPGGREARADPFISSGTGSPSFSYPTIDGCAGAHSVRVSASGPIAVGVTVSVEAVGREC